MIDICCNLTHTALNSQLPDVLERARQADVQAMVVPGSDVEDSAIALKLVQQHAAVLWANVGVHPHHADHWTNASYTTLKRLATDIKVIAIGETGLDYYRNLSTPATQRFVFEKQIELAVDTGLPLFMHQRDAHEDFIEILKPYRKHLSNAVVHCFTGNQSMLDDYMAMDLYIGVTGWICDERRAKDLRAAVVAIPNNRLLLETDAPYLIPRTLGKHFYSKPNEPSFLPHIAQHIAQRRNIGMDDLITQTINNSCNFYGNARLLKKYPRTVGEG